MTTTPKLSNVKPKRQEVRMKHSATSLQTWMDCPRLFKAKYIDKVLPFVPNAATERGNRIHDTLEKAVGTGIAPPKEEIWTPPGLISALHRAGAVAEFQMALDAAGRVTDYFATDAVLRGKMDVYLPSSDRVVILDWKTGKVRPKKLQADVYTAMAEGLVGTKADIMFRYVYLDHEKVVPLDRQDAQPRIFDLIEQVEADQDFLPTPGWLCRYCEYRACRFNTNPHFRGES